LPYHHEPQGLCVLRGPFSHKAGISTNGFPARCPAK
jgi:hypothetical protein